MSFKNGIFIPKDSSLVESRTSTEESASNNGSRGSDRGGRGSGARSFQQRHKQESSLSSNTDGGGRSRFRNDRERGRGGGRKFNHGHSRPPNLMDIDEPLQGTDYVSPTGTSTSGTGNISLNPEAPAFQPMNFIGSNNTQFHDRLSGPSNIQGEDAAPRRNRLGKHGRPSGQHGPSSVNQEYFEPLQNRNDARFTGQISSRRERRDQQKSRQFGMTLENDRNPLDCNSEPSVVVESRDENATDPKKNRPTRWSYQAKQQSSNDGNYYESSQSQDARSSGQGTSGGGRRERNRNYREPYDDRGHFDQYTQSGRNPQAYVNGYRPDRHYTNANRDSSERDFQRQDHFRPKSFKHTRNENNSYHGGNDWRSHAGASTTANAMQPTHNQYDQDSYQMPAAILGNTEDMFFGAGNSKNSPYDTRQQEKLGIDIVNRPVKHDARNQRETLTDQLSRNAYDCMICVEKVRRSQPIWSCTKCYNVFHLNCLRKWASSSADEVGWRCPGCQTYCEVIPSDYMCFCGAVKNPQANRSDVPHSCGQSCSRYGIGGVDCIHSCSIQCHPGPCPPCEALQKRNCCCGKTTAQVKCSSKVVLTCKSTCDKLLNCGLHKCTRPCHGGDCDPCSVIIKLKCYCESETKEILCTEETCKNKDYSCTKTCNRILNCKKHNCDDACHPGQCKPCKMSPEAILSCPCGQTSIAEACQKRRIPLRKSCLDPIPTCGKTCRKILPCGEAGASHTCQVECHLKPQCPPCCLVTPVKCRCGNKTFEIPCREFQAKDDVLCEKKCTKKRSCGRHKCNIKCCIDPDHICSIVCDRPLRCGNHNCPVLCHNGHCPPCRTVSFDELACECGASIIYPPVPCGTKPPQCRQPCPRTHDCDHPVLHTCHSDPTCPPCTVLTQKWCNGKHELRKNVMCHIKQLSCGMQCKKRLPCGRHNCVRVCHPNECLSRGEVCKLPCEIRKSDCGHSCGAPCHDGPCPESKCKLMTDVTCECGRKKETMVCWKREKEYDLVTCYMKGLELKRLRNVDPNVTEEPNIDEEAVLASIKEKTPKTHVLECDKECARVERNRKLVEALQLEDPDVTSTFGTPNYSDFLTTFAKKNPQFIEMIHERLTKLVVKARQSKRKNETYAFESMNRDKRHVVHEYSDHFGCLSESFDEEPNRNVLCTASKEKSYIPAVSLIDAVFRPSVKSERKNAFNDVEIFQNSKSQILRPANGKIKVSPRPGSGMVALSGPSASSALPNGDFPPLS